MWLYCSITFKGLGLGKCTTHTISAICTIKTACGNIYVEYLDDYSFDTIAFNEYCKMLYFHVQCSQWKKNKIKFELLLQSRTTFFDWPKEKVIKTANINDLTFKMMYTFCHICYISIYFFLPTDEVCPDICICLCWPHVWTYNGEVCILILCTEHAWNAIWVIDHWHLRCS